MVKSALGLVAMAGLGGNVYQSQNPVCDEWVKQVEVVRAEGAAREVRTRKHVMEWVDRVCPRDTTNMSSEAVFASYPFEPIYVPVPLPSRPCASGASSCPEWPCESDYECLDCLCNEDGYCD